MAQNEARQEAARRYDREDVRQSFVAGWASQDDPETIKRAEDIPDSIMRDAFMAGVAWQPGQTALKQVTFQATVTMTMEEQEIADSGLEPATAARHYLEAGRDYMNAAHDAAATQVVTYITGWRNA